MNWWKMVFLDTNILIYALCQNIDNQEQQDISVQLLNKAITNKNLILSELILCEFVFTSKKIKENEDFILQNLEFLSQFVKDLHSNSATRIIEILKESKQYNSSFDISHLAFCEQNNCKLITFDNGFKKLQNLSKIEVIVK